MNWHAYLKRLCLGRSIWRFRRSPSVGCDLHFAVAVFHQLLTSSLMSCARRSWHHQTTKTNMKLPRLFLSSSFQSGGEQESLGGVPRQSGGFWWWRTMMMFERAEELVTVPSGCTNRKIEMNSRHYLRLSEYPRCFLDRTLARRVHKSRVFQNIFSFV